jgi:hypothetical protein
MLDPVLERALDNPGIALRPVVTAARDQPHAVAVAFKAEAMAVILHFVEPVGAGRNAGRVGREAEVK